MRHLLAACSMIFCAGAIQAEEIVAALSQNRISITANFDGSEIFLFGAVKRDEQPPVDEQLDVIITIAGPLEPAVVRKKAKRFGIWINTDSFEFTYAPSLYAVASTGPMNKILKGWDDFRHRIGVERMINPVTPPGMVQDERDYIDALVRIRQNQGLYSTTPATVDMSEDTLFVTHIALPANLVEGDYTARIFLVRDGSVVDSHDTTIYVRKVGLERWIYNLANQEPLVYGLLCVLLAVFAGWAASIAFRRA